MSATAGSLLFYPENSTKLESAVSSTTHRIDPDFVSRIKRAYHLAIEKFEGHGESMWRDIVDRSSDIHECLMNGSDAALSTMLENPGSTNLFYGFDSLVRGVNFHEGAMGLLPQYTFDCFVRLAEATQANRIWNPEYGDPFPTARPNYGPVDVEDLLHSIDKQFGFKIDFPNPFPGEGGLATGRGIAGYRAPHAIYQAWRVRDLANKFSGERVLEIGAGLGRNAYYSKKFGVPNYTIVDLPSTNVAQALFLGQALGPDAIWLPGDVARAQAGRVRIVAPHWFQETNEHFDIVINADSMTEMDRGHAAAYVEKIGRTSRVFISINHENNAFTVGELCDPGARIARSPYWLRKGYVEELFFFGSRWERSCRRIFQAARRFLRPRTRLQKFAEAAGRLLGPNR